MTFLEKNNFLKRHVSMMEKRVKHKPDGLCFTRQFVPKRRKLL